jgi:hypothetical protein
MPGWDARSGAAHRRSAIKTDQTRYRTSTATALRIANATSGTRFTAYAFAAAQRNDATLVL